MKNRTRKKKRINRRRTKRQYAVETLESRLPLAFSFLPVGSVSFAELIDNSATTIAAAYDANAARVLSFYQQSNSHPEFSAKGYIAAEAARKESILASLSEEFSGQQENCSSGYCKSVKPADVVKSPDDDLARLRPNQLAARSMAEDLSVNVSFRLGDGSEGFSVFFTDEAGQSLADGTAGTLGISADFTLTFPGVATDPYARLSLGVTIGEVNLGYFLHVPESLPLVADEANDLELLYVSQANRLEVSINGEFITEFDAVDLSAIALTGTENLVIGVTPATGTTFIGNGSFGQSQASPVTDWSVSGAIAEGEGGVNAQESLSSTAETTGPPVTAVVAAGTDAASLGSSSEAETSDETGEATGDVAASANPSFRVTVVPVNMPGLQRPTVADARFFGRVFASAELLKASSSQVDTPPAEAPQKGNPGRERLPGHEGSGGWFVNWLADFKGKAGLIDAQITMGLTSALVIGHSPGFLAILRHATKDACPQEVSRNVLFEIPPIHRPPLLDPRRKKKKLETRVSAGLIDACFANIDDLLNREDDEAEAYDIPSTSDHDQIDKVMTFVEGCDRVLRFIVTFFH